MRITTVASLLALLAVVHPSALGAPPPVAWDGSYEGDVLPDSASPAWTHEVAGGTSQILSGTYLQMLDPEAWYYEELMYPSGPVTFLYNDPLDPGVSYQQLTEPCFTIEWRMKINSVNAGTSPGDAKVGIKLKYKGYPPANFVALSEWYYDVDNTRVVNNKYAPDYQHAGKTGPEGSETNLNIDAFTGIDLGEWHTYRLTSAKIGNGWHRELWLDGEYVGRWWDDTPSFDNWYRVTMEAREDLSPDSDVEFDYVRWADEPGGKYILVVSGDIDGDNDVDLEDYNTLHSCFGETPPWDPTYCEDADLDGDEVVDCVDFDIMVQSWTGPPPLEDIVPYEPCPCIGVPDADFDCDGDVDQTDFDTLESCFGLDPTGTCERADIDGDDDIDCVDYGELIIEWTGPPQDPPALAQCQQLNCELVNGGFEDGWTNWITSGEDMVCESTFCSWLPVLGDCFAQAARNNVMFGESYELGLASEDHPGWTLARIVDVTNPGGLSLSVDFSCYYLLAAASFISPNYTGLPDEIHQVWDIGYRPDGQDPTGPDDGCLIWTELTRYDGTNSMWGDMWCAAEWVYLPPLHVDITNMVACPSKVVLRMRSWADLPLPAGTFWYFSFVDEVEACVSGQGGSCPGSGDLDEDGDVDGVDQGILEGCYTGPGVALACGTPRADLDGDNDVDCADFARFDDLRPGGADPWATCPDLTCPNVVQNGGFETGVLDPWVATAGEVLAGCGEGCGFVPVAGDYFLGASANDETMDFYLAQIVPVTNPGGTALNCELSLYYLLSSQAGSDLSPGAKQPTNVHQHWELGYRADGHFPESVDDPQLLWIELVAEYDGTTSMQLVDTVSGDTYCDAGWVRLDEEIGPIQLNLSPGVCLKSVVLRMHGTADAAAWWSVNLVDEVHFCAAGDGSTCINPGDLDQDGDVDDADITQFDTCMDDYEISGQVPPGPPCSLADLDGDNDIDCDDYATLLYWYDQPWPPQESTNCPCADNGPGDLDCDGDVDQTDVDQFRTCLGNPPTPDKYHPGCGRADMDEDGDVDCWDFCLLRSYWTEGGIPPFIPECSCVLTNGGFESGTFDSWEKSGVPAEPEVYSEASGPCYVPSQEGTYYAGKFTESVSINAYVGRIIDVTEPGGGVLNVSAEAYYRIAGTDYIGGYPHGDEVHQVWEIGYNSDGSDPTDMNDADTWVTVADLDGTLTQGSDPDEMCDETEQWVYHGPVIKQIDLSGSLVTKAIFRVHLFTTRTNEWNADLIDDVEVCFFGLGGPYVASTDPPKGSAVASLPQVSVTFNDTVTGVDAGDLTVNGSPATGLTGAGAGPYVFSAYADPGPGTVTVVLASGGIQDSQSRPFAGDSWNYLDICDYDRDGDVDGTDLDILTQCYSGPDGGVAGGVGGVPCGRCDVDSDVDVDLIDFATLQAHYSG